MDAKIESPSDRYERYTTARNRSDLWREDLRRTYELALPIRDTFEDQTPGDSKTNEIFDTTAMQGVQSFANNIQSIMVPPGKRWATLTAGTTVPDSEKEAINKQLQGITEKIFHYLDSSNFNLVVNEALQDMAVSTGVLLMNEGTIEEPLEFSCAPMSHLSFESGKNGVIENVWRKWNISIRQLKKQWPDAVIPAELTQGKQSKHVQLIEGTIFYPENPIGKQWLYYVQMVDGKKDIVSELLEFSPWIAFRFRVTPGEVIGYGPALMALNTIQTANKMAEFELKIAQFRAYPPYTAPDSGTVNPYTLRLEPGSIIPIDPSHVGQRPIDLLPVPGDANFSQLLLTNLQQQINDMLFAEPLGPAQGPTATATEVSTRQQNWLRKSTASFGRLMTEMITPVMTKALLILRKKGLIEPIIINNKEVIEIDVHNLGIDFESPLFELQNQDDFQRVETLIQAMQTLISPQAPLISMDMAKLPGWMAEKLGTDLELMVPEAKIASNVSQLNQQQQQQQQQQAIASGQQQPPVPEPPQDQVFNQVPIQTS